MTGLMYPGAQTAIKTATPWSRNGRKRGRPLSAVCKQCGGTEQSMYGSKYYLCCICTESRVDAIRKLAAQGLTQHVIGDSLYISQNTISFWCRKHGIKTASMGRKRAKPLPRVRDPFRRPVQPTANALRAVSVFNLGAA